MEVEPKITKQYKCHHRCRERGLSMKKKRVFASFFGGPKDGEFVERIFLFWGIL